MAAQHPVGAGDPLPPLYPSTVHTVPFLSIALQLLLLLTLSGGAHAATPPQEEMRLYLELVVNGRAIGHVAPVDYRHGRYYLSREDFAATRLPATHWLTSEDDLIDLNSADGVTLGYDQATQRLLIDVPAAWLPAQTVSRNDRARFFPAQTSSGALFNYDSYAQKTRHGEGYLSTWTELRLFGDYGNFSTTGRHRQVFSGARHGREGYLRYDTRWEYSDQTRMLTLEAGDTVTRALAWSNPVRIGGLQLSRNFTTRPDIVTYPLPRFAGETGLPSTVDLFIDGYRLSSDPVEPGPFTLTDIPYINGAGEAVIVTTDALGRQVSTTVPFYVASTLLQRGLSDYSASVGALRRHYGQRDFAYGTLAANGNYRYGLSDALTIESHIETSRDLRLGGAGALLRLGRLGVLNFSHSRSSLDGQSGRQSGIGYQYITRRFNIAARQNWRSDGYRDLASLDHSRVAQRRTTQLSAGMSLGRYGSLSGGYFAIVDGQGSRTRLTNLSWGYSLGRAGQIYASLSKSNSYGNWTGMLQWSLSLDPRHGNLSAALERTPERKFAQRVNYSRNVPSDGGWGWNLGYRRYPGRDDYQQADVKWRNRLIELRGGVYGGRDDRSKWANARGSLVWMDNDFFFANEVRDAFVVVSTDGMAKVPVRYENRPVGETDRRGHLLVPWPVAYYPAKYGIDPLDLPASIRVPLVEQRVAVKRGGGYLLRFPLQRVTSASIRLVDAQGTDLPVGAQARLADGRSAYIGWDGLTYFDELGDDNRLSVLLPDGGRCEVRFALPLPPDSDSIPQIGPLPCLPETSR